MGIWVERTRERENAFCHLEMRATPGIWAAEVCVCERERERESAREREKERVVCVYACESKHTSGKPVHAYNKSELQRQPHNPASHLHQQARSTSSYRHTTTSNKKYYQSTCTKKAHNTTRTKHP
jgi:hypothetical protein